MSLTIAIDFDDTFSADPVLWSHFVAKANELGHRVLMVTARRDSEENIETVNSLLDHHGCPMPVIFTSLASKTYTVERHGIEIDIWIDDDPESLVRGH